MNEKKPSKKDFAELINKITGQDSMTEEKLDKILEESKKSYKKDGMSGVLKYLRDITQAPVSDEWMDQLLQKLMTKQGLKDVVEKYNIPLEFQNSKNKNSSNKKKK